MKKPLIPFIASLVLLATNFAQAEVVIYSGIEKELITGENKAQRTTWKVFVIGDHNTGNFARLRYGTVDGAKTLRTLVHTNSHIVQVFGANAQIHTAITRIPTDCDAQEFPGSESVYFKGPNAILSIGVNSSISFPRVLSVIGGGLAHSNTSGDPILEEASFVLTFNRTQTITSNTLAETLDAAFSRLIAYVRAQGY